LASGAGAAARRGRRVSASRRAFRGLARFLIYRRIQGRPAWVGRLGAARGGGNNRVTDRLTGQRRCGRSDRRTQRLSLLRLAFALPHFPDPFGNPQRPVDREKKARDLVDSQLPGGQFIHNDRKRRLGIIGRLDHRQGDWEPTIAGGRNHPLHHEPLGGQIAVLGALDHVVDDLLGLFLEGGLNREGLLVQAAGRATAGIAALPGLELHG